MRMPPTDMIDQSAPSLCDDAGGRLSVERLPPVEADFPGGGLAAPAVPFGAGVSSADPAPADLPRGTRPGVFQKLLFEADLRLPRNGDEGFGFDTLELKTVLGLPCPTREYPLLITPGLPCTIWTDRRRSPCRPALRRLP